MSSLRIDTPIKPTSHLRLLLYATLASVLLLLAWSANLSLWQYVFILIIAALVISYLALSQPILLHLSQPPLSSSFKQGWQLLVRSSRGDALWQADLIKIQRYQHLMHLQFKVVEPYHKIWSVTVYRDQMSCVHWQQLNVLATVTQAQSG